MELSFLLLFFLPHLSSISLAATLGKSIKVPDSDATLKSLITRSVLQQTNNELHDSVWWVPVTNSPLKATKTTVAQGTRLYTTYDFTLTSAKSTCSRNAVPYASISKCTVDPKYSDRQTCKVSLAWYERDYSSIEMETYCSLQAGLFSSSKP